jgi:hypothetical protein
MVSRMNLFIGVPRNPEASIRLSRSQFAQKVGSRDRSYPRPTGVLIPRALATVCDAELSHANANDPKNVGRAIVLRVSRTLRSLPQELLTLDLPHPSTVLRALPIEDRTRGVIERLLPVIAKETVWTVDRYLRIPRFGARCLVDLLAACEEANAPISRQSSQETPLPPGEPLRTLLPIPSIDLARLDDISRLLRHMLPISEEELARLLVDEGLASMPVRLEQLAEAYQAVGQAVAFQVITCGEMAVAVSGHSRGFSATVAGTAVRLVSHWGLSTVQSVVERVGLLRSSPTSRPMVNRLLVTLPRLRWLDDHLEWFSLVGDRSRLRRAIATIFAVTDRVALRELRMALGKGQPRAPRVPPTVLARYLSEIADCEVEPTGIRRRATEPEGRLAGDEAILVDLLSRAGDQLEVAALGRLASAASIPPARVRTLLLSSPLFLPVRGQQVRLVGHHGRP